MDKSSQMRDRSDMRANQAMQSRPSSGGYSGRSGGGGYSGGRSGGGGGRR